MKYLLFDANNVAALSFHRARSIMMKEIHEKIDLDNQDELIEEAKKNIHGFASHLFFNKIHTIIRSNKDYHILFVWDGKYGSVWRKKENVSYKANRVHDNDDMYSIYIDTMNSAYDILKFYPVLQFVKQDAEADDLIYSINRYLDPEDEVKVVSTDSDMIQLAQQFENVSIWNPIKKKFYEVPDYEYVVYKSIVGDKSDNIQGVPRYGETRGKRAAREGIQTLKEEFQKIVNKNLEIIDLSRNPHELENFNYVKTVFEDSISYDLEQIKRMFFNLKLKNQIDKFGTTAKLLKSLV